MKKIIYILIFILGTFGKTFSQDYNEYYFKFEITDKSELDTITQIISIDNVMGLEVFAYANQQELDEFQKMDYKIVFLQKDVPKSLTMATTVAEMSSWNRYPTYSVYRQLLKNFESNYPSICKLDSIGTTKNGRKLYMLKISDNVSIEENEPEFLYTSTIHGDEATGFVLMLRLADSILSSYNTKPNITNLVNEIEIFINPNANPDGTYYGGDNTVSSARRYNANGVDLNRDFPDPRIGANTPYQPETQIMMDFAEEHNIVMSANFHGGAEVMNYPWDTWTSSQNPHADTDWFERICTNYVTTARTVLSNYMSSIRSDGVTEGGDWYVITGGRQDYMSYWHQCREVTIEISNTKLLAVESLNNYWNYNKISLLNYMNECLFGVRGVVKSVEGFPLDAMIWIIDHDSSGDSSMVFTDSDLGDYHRLIEPGLYDIVASSEGYISDTVKGVSVTLNNVTWINFNLVANDDSIALKTDPVFINDTLFFDQLNTHDIVISNDSSAAFTNYEIEIENGSENPWLELDNYSGTLYGIENDTIVVSINSDLLSAGYFSANILLTSADSKIDTIPVHILVKDTVSLQCEPDSINQILFYDQFIEQKIIITNSGPSINADYNISIENNSENSWLVLNKYSGLLLGNTNDTIIATINSDLLNAGYYATNIHLLYEDIIVDTISINILIKDTISTEIYPEIIMDTLWGGELSDYEIFIENNGLISLNYSIQIEDNESNQWISLDKHTGDLLITETDTVKASVTTHGFGFGNFNCNIIIEKENSTNDTIPVAVYVKDTVSVQIEPEFIIDTIWGGENSDYNLMIKNDGLISINYSIQIEDEESKNWVSLTKLSGNLISSQIDTIKATITTDNFGFGNFSCNFIINTEYLENDTIPLNINVRDTINFKIDPTFINDTLNPDTIKEFPVVISNTGPGTIKYTSLIGYLTESESWTILANEVGNINGGSKDTIFVNVDTKDLASGNYTCTLIISEETGKNQYIPINIYVNSAQSVELMNDISEFKLYPNPFSEQISLEFITFRVSQFNLSIYTISGNTVFEKNIATLNNKKHDIILNNIFNVQNLPNGIYFIQISTSNYKITKKIIKN